MFLFKQEHVEPILNGTKTQTRRIWKRRRAVPGSLHWAQRDLTPGSRFARLRVLRVWQERLRSIGHEDANAEGYPHRLAYLAAFKQISGHKMRVTNPVVWCVEFELVEAVRDEAA